MEEAAIKRQRAEASLRAKQEAIKKKEKQIKEARYKKYLSDKQQQDRQQQLELEEENRKQVYIYILKVAETEEIGHSQPKIGRAYREDLTKSRWRERFDASSGYPYYENVHTGESQWENQKGFDRLNFTKVYICLPQQYCIKF